MELGDLRRDYRRGQLDAADLAPDPLEQFARWFDDAKTAGVDEPNAMTLATADADGRPSARIVLLKGVDDNAFVFFTDYRSRKGQELEANPAAALVFYWYPLERQVRITGRVTRLDEAASRTYYLSRPIGSRIGAWASVQSQEIADRATLEARVAEARARYPDDNIPLPPHWGGYRLVPDEIEFWQGRPDRLHDRFHYSRTSEPGWHRARLSP
jgi:pyridoxamine 5'-phosphate oxidase